MSRFATRTSDFEAKAVLCALLIWLGFLVFHPIIRLAFDIELGPADSLELIAGQELKLNYRTRQPPLYTWFISISGQVFGPGALASQIVKYGFMAIAGLGFYLAGLSATKDRKKAALGSLAALLIFNVGFTIHDQSTHSVALIAAIALLCAGYMALCRSETPVAYVIIGVAGAIAVLSKHSGWILVLAFPFAFLLSKKLRPRILNLKLASAVAATLIAALPLIYFLLINHDEATRHLGSTVGVSAGGHPLWQLLRGQAHLVGGAVALSLPLAVLLAACFGSRGFVPAVAKRPSAGAGHVSSVPDAVKIMFASGFIGLGAIAIGLLVSGAGKFPSRHLLVVMLPIALALTWGIPSKALHWRNVRRFLVIVALLQVGLMITRTGSYALPGKPFCNRCNHLLPTKQLAAWIETEGYAGAIIVTGDRLTGGHLISRLQTDRVVYLGLPRSARPNNLAILNDARQTCIFITRSDAKTMDESPKFEEVLTSNSVRAPNYETVTARWPKRIDGRVRRTTWKIWKLSRTDPLCSSSGQN
ncbi:MAG: glycosyltransferase family 39 protein [Pseudomonadota bacterium]